MSGHAKRSDAQALLTAYNRVVAYLFTTYNMELTGTDKNFDEGAPCNEEPRVVGNISWFPSGTHVTGQVEVLFPESGNRRLSGYRTASWRDFAAQDAVYQLLGTALIDGGFDVRVSKFGHVIVVLDQHTQNRGVTAILSFD